jgi:hypothetical protein
MSHLSVPSRAGNTRQSREGGRLGSELTYIGFDRPERVERPSLRGRASSFMGLRHAAPSHSTSLPGYTSRISQRGGRSLM